MTSWNPRLSAFALAAVLRLEDQLERVLLVERGQQVAGAVGRAVVDDDELDAERHGEHARDDFLDRVLLVVDGHDDREQRIFRTPFSLDIRVIPAVDRRSRAGCASCHRQAVSTIESSAPSRGVPPEVAARARARRDEPRRDRRAGAGRRCAAPAARRRARPSRSPAAPTCRSRAEIVGADAAAGLEPSAATATCASARSDTCT